MSVHVRSCKIVAEYDSSIDLLANGKESLRVCSVYDPYGNICNRKTMGVIARPYGNICNRETMGHADKKRGDIRMLRTKGHKLVECTTRQDTTRHSPMRLIDPHF